MRHPSICWLLVVPSLTHADELIARQTGAIPIIISAPHGGRLKIGDAPIRKGEGVEKFVTVRDERTDDLALAVAAELEKVFNLKPWSVIAKFDRNYLDVNRPKEGAYESDLAKPVYEAYHRHLADACNEVKKRHGRGLLLDIHGQSSQPDAIIRGTQNGKSVTLLRERFGKEAFLGPKSLLGQMETAGYRVVPKTGSDDQEVKGLNGGYIVQTYGSHQAFAIDAIQLECGGKVRTKDAIPKTAKDLAAAIKAFHDAYIVNR